MESAEEFRWLFAAEYPAVVRAVFFVLHDHARAEEITQDAFVQLLTHWDKVGHYDAPSAWVRRVAIRLAMRDARRERRRGVLARRVADIPELGAPDVDVDTDLLAAMKRLPARQRSVVVLFYYEDRPMDEIARILGCSTATGWVHLHRARKRLAALACQHGSGGMASHALRDRRTCLEANTEGPLQPRERPHGCAQ